MDKALIWKDETGEYKLGYSQKLQEDIVRELKVSNIFKTTIIIILTLGLIMMGIIIKSNILSKIIHNMVC